MAGATEPPGCGHCATPLAGRYCHACGQDTQPPETAWRGWREQSQRLLRTLRLLVVAPGELAREHLTGGRIRYIPPFSLFLNIVAVFFLFSVATEFRLRSFEEKDATGGFAAAIAARAAKAGVTKEIFEERAERRFQSVYTVCVAVISLVGYTLLFRLFFRRGVTSWRPAFTLALLYLAFIFAVFLPLLAAVPWLARRIGEMAAGVAAAGISLVIATAWLASAAHTLFGDRWSVAVGKGVAIVLVGTVIDNLMFYTAVQLTLALA
jgi:hypothetical protein